MRGRPKSTGRYATRQELESAVKMLWEEGRHHYWQIAVTCKTTTPIVKFILHPYERKITEEEAACRCPTCGHKLRKE